MPYLATILADSTDGTDLPGNRLTTFSVTMPKCVVAEFNTSRTISRNSASSRAIPTARIIQAVQDEPYIPEWGRNCAGMQSREALDEESAQHAAGIWIAARNAALVYAETMWKIGAHKQAVNRLLEPWMWTTVIATATDVGWSHFFGLRCDEQADPAIRRAALAMRDAYLASVPKELETGDWHLPLIDDVDRRTVASPIDLPCISAARCARVSYLRHDERRSIAEDLERCQKLIDMRHPSPLEHQAQLAQSVGMVPTMTGNFGHCRWWQFRKIVGQ